MACDIRFLAVGNGDCIVIHPDNDPAVVVDIANTRKLTSALDALKIRKLACVFVTHAHSDHFPQLEEFESFLTNWLDHGGTLAKLSLPRGLVTAAQRRIATLSADDPLRAGRLQRAVSKLWDYARRRVITIFQAEQGYGPFDVGNLRVHVLHPSYMFEEIAEAERRARPNATSLVLRVEYGAFRAVLLADLEGIGTSECLTLPSEHWRSQVVKIPHHGAWPSNGNELAELLARIQPQLAVLSVGSTNRYRHVVPLLFDALTKLRDTCGTQITCTEVTRTCAHSALERAGMGSDGLGAPQPCAGDVQVVAQLDGTWVRPGRDAHLVKVATLPYAACTSRADLGLVSPPSLRRS